MHNNDEGPLTIRDIARIAGVSHSTVSRCLNDSPLISRETKELVLRIAEEKNFQFNANARALASRRTDTIGILYPVTYDDPRNLQYTKLLLHDLQESLASHGFDALPTSKNDRTTGQSNIQRLVTRRKVDGFIVIGSNPDEQECNLLGKYAVPAVLVDPYAETDDFDIYATNNFSGALEATECLLGRGNCSSPITVSIGPGEITFSDRTRGFLKSLGNHGISGDDRVFTFPSGPVFDAGYAFIKNHIGTIRSRRIDGIFAQADLLALGMISALREEGVEVPKELRIVGFDDALIGSYFYPRLTTMHQPREQIAHSACARLKYLLSNHGVPTRIKERIAPTLVLRESC